MQRIEFSLQSVCFITKLGKCIELTRVPVTAFAEDVYRLFTPTSTGEQFNILKGTCSCELADGIALRKFTDEFRLTDTWLVTFASVDDAKAALKKVAGARIALRTLEASLVLENND